MSSSTTSAADESRDAQDTPRALSVPETQRVPMQIMSDLHLEFRQRYSKYAFKKTAPYLALLGDIGLTANKDYLLFLQRMLEKYEKVFLLLGNHEGYSSSYDASRRKVQAFINGSEKSHFDRLKTLVRRKKRGQLIFLDRTRHDVDDNLTVLGCTLWSKIDPEHQEYISVWMNDFKRVKDWTTTEYVNAHGGDLQWLNEQVITIAKEEPHRRIAIFTHHAPTIRGTSSPDREWRPQRSAYATELAGAPCWTTNNVVLWAFGHTHWCCDFVREGVRVYQNSYGDAWKGGNKDFDAEKVVDV